MTTCTDHSFIVVYREDSCPVCAMERQAISRYEDEQEDRMMAVGGGR